MLQNSKPPAIGHIFWVPFAIGAAAIFLFATAASAENKDMRHTDRQRVSSDVVVRVLKPVRLDRQWVMANISASGRKAEYQFSNVRGHLHDKAGRQPSEILVEFF